METPLPVLLYKPQGTEDPDLPTVAKDTFFIGDNDRISSNVL